MTVCFQRTHCSSFSKWTETKTEQKILFYSSIKSFYFLGEKVPQDAQAHKDEMGRIHKYMVDLQEKVRKECDNFSEDVKYWAEYKTGIKEFLPWLTSVEADSTNGLAKPSSLAEATALSEKVHKYEAACAGNLKVLEAANAAAIKMTTHKVHILISACFLTFCGS